MSIGSIGSSKVPTTAIERRRGEATPEAAAPKTISEHVAELDEQEPIRSASTTRGTLIDTYL
jgi:hypothetical protein